jgi:[ribosomal protein S5]-alanine N-acetyltransferase
MKVTQPTEIVTERLRLVPLAMKYCPDIFREFTAEVAYYMTPQPAERLEVTEKFVRETIENMEAGKEIVFAILDKTSSDFMGMCGIHHIDTPHPVFGIWTKMSVHGHGFGREAIHGAKAWCDEHLAYEYLVYPVDKRNIPSRRIPESLSGIVVKEYEGKTADGARTLYIVEYHIPRPSKSNV